MSYYKKLTKLSILFLLAILGPQLLFKPYVNAQVSDVPSRVVDSRPSRSLTEEEFRARTREHFLDDYDYEDDAEQDGEIVRTGKSFRSRHFTSFLQPREELCFTVNLKKGDTLTINMLVLRGGDSKLWLFVRDQLTKKHIDPKMPAKEMQKVLNAPRDGGYDICMSNKWSMSHSKVGSIDIAISHQKEYVVEETDDRRAKLVEKQTTNPRSAETEQDDPFLKEDDTKEKARQFAKDFADMQQIQNVIRKLQINIGRTKMYILRLKSLMRTDAFQQTDQHTWITSWSTLVCVSMFIVYFSEVYLIRHWFNNSSSSGRKGVYKQTGMRMGL